MELFDRDSYLSQTQIVKRYQLNVKQFKQLIKDHNLQVIAKEIDLGEFKVITCYVKREDIDKLNLPTR